MVGLPRRTRVPDDCGRHHWHVTAHGWECCGCGHALGQEDRPPTNEADDCRRPDEHPDESIAAWLPEVDPDVCAPDTA